MENNTPPFKPKISIFKNIFKGCRILTIVFILLFCFFIVLGIYVITQKPIDSWNSIVNFLNNGKSIPQVQTKSINEITDNLNSQINNISGNTIEIKEEDLLIILKNNVTYLNIADLDLTNNSIKLFWILENSNNSNPLLGEINLGIQENGDISIDKLGTVRIALPKAISNSILELALKSLNTNLDVKNLNIKDFLVQNANIEINSIKVEEEKLVINLDLKNSIF